MATSRVIYYQSLFNPNFVVSMNTAGGAVAQSAPSIPYVQPYHGGAATIVPGGVYSSHQERQYQINVHSTTDGSFANTRYRWSDGTTWNEQGVIPQPNVPKLLSHGIQITPVPGGFQPEFQLGDTWWFKVVYKHGIWAALDSSRNTEWRSGPVPHGGAVSWDMDFGTPIRPTVFYLLDINFPAGTKTELWANNTGLTSAPSFVHVAGPSASPKILEFMTPPTSYRYWRLIMTNLSGVTWGYFRFSEIFLGLWQAFSKNFLVDYVRPIRRLSAPSTGLRYGVGAGSLWGDDLELTFSRMPAVDHLLLYNLWSYINRPDIGTQLPFAFVPYDGDLSWWGLYHWVNDLEFSHGPSYRYSAPIQLQEVVRSRS